jgi:predicted Zn-dependent peptidase
LSLRGACIIRAISGPESLLFRRTTLDNGLRVVSTTIPTARSVSTAFFVGVGARHEQERIQGASHFVEHMLFKGTRSRPTAKDVSVSIEQLGGILNAETGKEVTVYWDKLSQRHWSTSIELLADVLRNSLFAAEEVEKERAVIVEELSMLFDSPVDWVHLLIDEAVWGDHPLGRDVGGTRDSVQAMTREDLVGYVDRCYSPHNTVVAVAGPIEHDDIVTRVRELLDDWSPRPAVSWDPVPPGQVGPKFLLRSKDTEQAHVCLALPGVSYADRDRYAFDLLNVILGEGMSSRLFLELREKRGLAYDVHSYVNRFRDTGSLVIYAGVDPGRAINTVETTLEELDKLKSGIPAEEVGRAKDFWKGRMELRLEETRSLASWVGSQELLLDRIYTLEEVVAHIDSVTHDDLVRVSNQYFDRALVNLAVIGPFDDDADFRQFVTPAGIPARAAVAGSSGRSRSTSRRP